jgi:TldD protein
VDPEPWQTLAQQAIDTARSAGAQYADARLTRIVQHHYSFAGPDGGSVTDVSDVVGVGVRTLVNGYWGFTASPVHTTDEVVRLARDAVAQARVNARGTSRTVEMVPIPRITGHWVTPIATDPFTIPVEEKLDTIAYWMTYAERVGVEISDVPSYLHFARQDRIVATSEGTLVTQTCYETSGKIEVRHPVINQPHAKLELQGLTPAALGWELFAAAHIPEQLDAALAGILDRDALHQAAQPALVGRYTFVCDGVTMASMVEQTMGIATQLDRALGYEANAGGTSFLDDPLSMVGQLQVAAPLVTITGNRNVPTQLATVQWDDEGVVPESFPIVQQGVLVDFQTTREQATWLAPYYARAKRPARSHGCAAAEDGLSITLQHMPNLALAPNPQTADIAALMADVKDGVLIEGGSASADFQARTGLLRGNMRKITNGKLGAPLNGGGLLFDTLDFWKNVRALGDTTTTATRGTSQYRGMFSWFLTPSIAKGQPAQMTSHSVQAVAATIANQPLIDPTRKA